MVGGKIEERKITSTKIVIKNIASLDKYFIIITPYKKREPTKRETINKKRELEGRVTRREVRTTCEQWNPLPKGAGFLTLAKLK
jgi:hypothetical protein